MVFFSNMCECVTLWKTWPKLILSKSDLLFIKSTFFDHSGLIRASRRSWRECSRNGRKESSRPTRPSASSRLCMQGKLNCYKIFSLLVNKRGLPGAARDYFTISLWNSPVQIDLRTLRALGWGEPPTNKIFIFKPTPRSNFCLLAPAQFSKHTPPFGRVDPAGPRFGWGPPPNSLPFRVFQMGSL